MSKAGTYSFQAEPRPVVDARSKFREPQEQKVASNIMHDRRVVRGNTYSSIIPTAAQTRALQAALEQKEMQQKRATQMRTMAIARQREIARQRALEPEPVPGRAHMPVQTDDVLEELVDKVLETDHGTQTDPIDDRPEPPKFKTKDPGVDKSTEILAGELFNFDLAVEPILEVIVGKCLDQGLMEVLEEEEMKRIQSHKRSFEEKRDALIADAQKLEAATQRRYDEKERRLKQERERVAREQDLAKKLAAQSVAKQFLAGLPNTIDRKLEKDGFYMDPILTQIQSDFMPWLMKNVATHLEQTKEAQRQVDDIITAAINGVRAQRVAKIKADKEEAERIRKEQEAERARQEAERIRLAEEKAKREREEEERRKKAEEEEEGDHDEDDAAAD